MCSGQESAVTSECTQAELAPIFEAVEHSLDDVACFVKFSVVFILHFAVFSGWDAGCGFCLRAPIAQVVCVIATICDDGALLADIGLKTLACPGNICPVASCQVQMHWSTATIANQMQLGIQTTFGLPDAAPVARVFLTPLAAIRWALRWLASIMSLDRSAVSRASVSKIRSKTPASEQPFQRLSKRLG